MTEPGFSLKGTELENISAEDAAEKGYELYVDPVTGDNMMRRAPLPMPWVKQEDDQGRMGYFNPETEEFSFRRPGQSKVGVFKKNDVHMTTAKTSCTEPSMSTSATYPDLHKYEKMRTSGVPILGIRSRMTLDKVPENIISQFLAEPDAGKNGKPTDSRPPAPDLSAAKPATLKILREEPSLPLISVLGEENILSIRRQFGEKQRKQERDADIIAAMLRKLTNEKPQIRRGQPQIIALDRAFNALGMLRSVLYAEEQYNSVYDAAAGDHDDAYITYLQRPYLELLSGFGTKVDKFDEKSILFGLKDVIEAIEGQFEERINAHVERFHDSGLVEFDGLAELYKPGTRCVYPQAGGLAFGVVVVWCKYEEGKTLFGKTRTFHVGFQFIASVGDAFTPIDFVEAMTKFDAPREISNLPFAPLAFMKDRDQNYWTHFLSKRGDSYNRYACGNHYVSYAKDSFHQFLSATNGVRGARSISKLRQAGRVMLDTSFAHENGYTANVGYAPAVHSLKLAFGAHSRQLKQSMDQGAGSSVHDPDGDLVLFKDIPQALRFYTWPTITGFSFSGKCWGQVVVHSIDLIQFNSLAFHQLVLPEDRKQLIKALVQYSSDTFADIIRGKGEGSVFLLYGPPGVGKTLTAEAIAEMLGRPLYQVSMGELGESGSELEEKLEKVFRVCSRWNALVLLDEADVFLEKRTSEGSITRNAMVSVMLRLVEYFQGVLFLTTNRVKAFDPAFQTRITVALRYHPLDQPAREKVWTNLLVSSGHEQELQDGDVDVQELAQQPMNGREIKNAIRLALALSLDTKDTKLLQKHLLNTVKICTAFHEELDAAAEY